MKNVKLKSCNYRQNAFFKNKFSAVPIPGRPFFIILGLILLCAGTVFSASLEDLTSSEQAAQLSRSTGPLTQVQVKNPQTIYVPEHSGIKSLINNARESLQPSVIVESLYLYPKPGKAALNPNTENLTDSWTEEQRRALYNQALGISTLAGIQYYSASRDGMRTLYETSQIIDGPITKKPLPDPVYSNIPAMLSLFARQKDLTFGDNIYRYEYYSYPDAFVFMQENITSMNAGIIPALGKNKLRSFMAVCDAGDSLLIYTTSMAKAVSLPGMDNRIGDSFSNRAQAILKWFTGRAETVLH